MATRQFIVKNNLGVGGGYLTGLKYDPMDHWLELRTFWTLAPDKALKCPTAAAAYVLANLAEMESFEIVELSA